MRYFSKSSLHWFLNIKARKFPLAYFTGFELGTALALALDKFEVMTVQIPSHSGFVVCTGLKCSGDEVKLSKAIRVIEN